MKRILLVAILLLSSCAFRMKHRWENGLVCKCRGSFVKGEMVCECMPNKIPQCPEPKK